MNLPPVISFAGNKDSAKLFKSQALQFYNFEIERANSGGIGFVSRIKQLPDGSSIFIVSRKEENHQLRTGKIVIFSPPVEQRDIEFDNLYVTVMDKNSDIGEFPDGASPPYQPKKNRFLYPKKDTLLQKVDFYSGGYRYDTATQGFTKGGSWFSDKLACSWNVRSSTSQLMFYVNGEKWSLNTGSYNSSFINSCCVIKAEELVHHYPAITQPVDWFAILIGYNAVSKTFSLYIYALNIADGLVYFVTNRDFLTVSNTLLSYTGLTYDGLKFCWYEVDTSALPINEYITNVIEFSDEFFTQTNTVIDSQTSGTISSSSSFTYTAAVGGIYTKTEAASSSLGSPGGYSNYFMMSERNGFCIVRSKQVGYNLSSSYNEAGSPTSLSGGSSFSNTIDYEVSIWFLSKDKDSGVWKFVEKSPMNVDVNISVNTVFSAAGTNLTGITSFNSESSRIRNIADILYCSTDPLVVISQQSYKDIDSSSTITITDSNPVANSSGNIREGVKRFVVQSKVNNKAIVDDFKNTDLTFSGPTANTGLPPGFGVSFGNDSGSSTDTSPSFGLINQILGNNHFNNISYDFTTKLIICCGFNNSIYNGNTTDTLLGSIPNPPEFTLLYNIKDGSYRLSDERIDLITGETVTYPISVTSVPTKG